MPWPPQPSYPAGLDPNGPAFKTFTGAGGSLVIADVDRGMTFAYVINKMRPDLVGPIAEALVERLYDIVTR